MTEQMLLRFAMILQNQAPSTLNKYICKLAEAVLLEHNTGLSLYALSQAINSQSRVLGVVSKLSRGIQAV